MVALEMPQSDRLKRSITGHTGAVRQLLTSLLSVRSRPSLNRASKPVNQRSAPTSNSYSDQLVIVDFFEFRVLLFVYKVDDHEFE